MTGQAKTIMALASMLAEPSEPYRAKTQMIDANQTKMKKALVNSAPHVPASARPSGVIPKAMTPTVNNQGRGSG